ncbi:MAG: glycosyltransferase family 9 protein [Phycisphaerales bacterium]|nr:glycosyltransferase family 9 protein [Phycisphaerales bacterium]
MNDNRSQRVLVLHQGAIGDFILTLSAVQAVSELLGGADVTVVATAPSARLAAGRSVVRRCLHPDQVGGHTLFQTDGPLDRRLLDLLGQADLVLSFLGGHDEAAHGRLKSYSSGQVVSVDPRPTHETITQRRHITRQWCDAIREEGLDIPDPTPPVIRLDIHRPEKQAQPRILIHPGSGGRSKCWPLEYFLALADSIQDAQVSWMLGPVEAERDGQMVDAIRRRSAETGEGLVIEADLFRATEDISTTCLYIGNDSGMTHLAAALGVPTIAIFTATDPAVWAPRGGHVRVIENQTTQEPLTPQKVIQAIREVDHGS